MVFPIPQKNGIRLDGTYSLNFDCFPSFLSLIDGKQDSLKNIFHEVANGGYLKTSLNTQLKTIEVLNLVGAEDEESQNIIADAQCACDKINAIRKVFDGASPYEIQDAVNKVLGINKDTDFSEKLKKEYFSALTQSGFLISEYDQIDQITHNPADEAKRFLTSHPEIESLIIGCGTIVDSYSSSCFFRNGKESREIHRDALKINITSELAPDVLADMHDLRFWIAIPDERFEKILDHTYGFFLFDSSNSEQTLKEIFRSLKPGGYLQIDLPFKEDQVKLLKKVGFEVAQEDGIKRAMKS